MLPIRKSLFVLMAGAVAALGLSSAARPASASVTKVTEPDSDPACHSTITKGAGATAVSACITATGNVMGFTVGNGLDNIFNEGYTLCKNGAYDASFVGDAGWGTPSIVQPNGPHTLPLKITRTSTDGAFRLVQDYALGVDSLTVTMTLTNLTAFTSSDVRFERQADVDAHGSFANSFLRSADSVAVIGGDGLPGITASAISFNVPHATGVSSAVGPTCNVASAATPVSGDFGAHLAYNLGNLNAGKAKTFKVRYQRL